LIFKNSFIENNAIIYKLTSDHGVCQVRERLDNRQRGLFSNHDFNVGEVLVKFSASNTLSEPDHLTIQLAQSSHIHLSPDYLQYVNHSCMPNVLFNTTTMEFECVREIKKGDELRFFYPATEWDMSQPFSCNCGSSNCLGVIKGASYMPASMLKDYKLSDFVRVMIENQ
jgi:hypothetical protein